MPRKNPHAVALGRNGGRARARKLTAEQRTESARLAGKARAKQRAEEGNKSLRDFAAAVTAEDLESVLFSNS